MPVIWVALAAAAVYFYTVRQGQAESAASVAKKAATQATGPVSSVVSGPLGAINSLFPAARKITRPVAAAAQQADPAVSLAQGTGAVLGGLFKDLGLGNSIPSPAGVTNQTAAGPDAQAVATDAQSSPIFTRDGGNSSLGSDQTVSGANSGNDLGLDSANTLQASYANTLQPGSTAAFNGYGQNAGATPDASIDAPAGVGVDLTGTSNATAPPVPDPVIPQDPGAIIDANMTDAVYMPEAVPVADSGASVDPSAGFATGGGF